MPIVRPLQAPSLITECSERLEQLSASSERTHQWTSNLDSKKTIN